MRSRWKDGRFSHALEAWRWGVMGFAMFCDACGEPMLAGKPILYLFRWGKPPQHACSDDCAAKLDPNFRGPTVDAASLPWGEVAAEQWRAAVEKLKANADGKVEAPVPASPVTAADFFAQPDRLGPVDLDAFLKSCE